MVYEGGMERRFTEDEVREMISVAVREAVAPLLAKIAELEEEIARLKRNSGNSSKPPSSDIVNPPNSTPSGEKRRGRRPRRKQGGQPGHKKHKRKPFDSSEIDRVVEYELPPERPRRLTPLDDWRIIQQVELVDRPFLVTEYRARRYRDERTGRIVTATMPREIVKAGLVGPRLSAAIAYQKSACHMSYSTIHNFWRDIGDLPLSRGQLVKVVQKASDAIAPAYAELRSALATQRHLGIDESGHKDNGRRHWTWCFRASDFTVFHIDRSRGSKVLREVLGDTFGGVIGCDYFSAYHKYMADAGVVVQFCMAHLIREIRFLAEHANKSLARWGKNLLRWIRKLFKTLHRCDQMTATGFARSMDRLRREFLKAVRRPPTVSEARTLAKRFRGAKAAHYFRFLTDPGVEPTNNLTEQAIRHVVIDRRITQGTRGDVGMRWCERAWTVLATCAQQGRRVFPFLHEALLAHLAGQPAPSLLAEV